MIIFENLKISKDGNNLIIKIRVREESYFDNIYIDKIIIDNEDSYTEGTPSNKPVYQKTIEGDNKEIFLSIPKIEFLPQDLTKNLFFVYIKTKGVPSPNIPCGMDNQISLGVTFYYGSYYNLLLQYVKEINNNCKLSSNFLDLYLKFKAMTLSFDSGHYIQGIKWYKQWFKNIKVINSRNCNCHG